MTDQTRATSLLGPEYRTASIAIYTAVALVAFEGTAVAAALPQLAGDLGRIDLLPWTITSFLFTSGLATVVAGPLIDAIGSRPVFRLSAVVFGLAGFAAGLAPTMPVLVALRLVQGLGAGMLVAVTLAAVNLVYPSALIGRAFAANSTIWGVMGAGAPAVAALILTTLSWRWLFFINLPLAAVSLLAGWRVMPDRRPGAEAADIDWPGVALIAVFTLSSLLAVDRIGLWSLVWLAVAVLAVGLYRIHAGRRANPVVRLEHVVAQPYLGLGLVVLLQLLATFATNIYITLYVSAGRGAGPGLTAWSVLFFTIGWTVGANLASRLMDHYPERWIMTAGVAATAGGLAVVALAVNLDLALPLVFAGLFIAGMGIGLSTNCALALLRRATPSNQIGRATAAHQFIRNQGFTLGSAVGGAVLLLMVARSLGSVEPVQRLLSGDDTTVTADVAQAVRSGYGTASILSLAVAVSAFWPMRRLRQAITAAGLARMVDD